MKYLHYRQSQPGGTSRLHMRPRAQMRRPKVFIGTTSGTVRSPPAQATVDPSIHQLLKLVSQSLPHCLPVSANTRAELLVGVALKSPAYPGEGATSLKTKPAPFSPPRHSQVDLRSVNSQKVWFYLMSHPVNPKSLLHFCILCHGHLLFYC